MPSKLGNTLLREWGEGNIRTPKVRDLAISARADGLQQPCIQKLAGLRQGEELSDLMALLREAGVHDMLHVTNTAPVNSMLLPTTVFRMLGEVPNEFDSRLGGCFSSYCYAWLAERGLLDSWLAE